MCHMARSRIQEYTYQLQFCLSLDEIRRAIAHFCSLLEVAFKILFTLFLMIFHITSVHNIKLDANAERVVLCMQVFECRLFGFCFNMKSITLAYSHWCDYKFLRLSAVIVDRSDWIAVSDRIAVSFAGSPDIVLPLLKMLFVIDDKIF
ncbi:hypothetical protein CTI12_AA573850 [Artemisia annua]|uniref:Uncharacterized protein n=1 Tax=Artemisia annua TaxID=35608 RepID=A0A2U1KR44_ARTAN|nr:hypothetical protein CTI12_AA573850 [Artemisia annua]